MTTAHAAYKESLQTSPAEIAAELQSALGQRLVAYAVGDRSPKTIGRWAAGETKPPPEGDLTLGKLRALYRVVLLLRDELAPETIRAWLSSPNPDLGEQIPAALLRDGHPDRVLTAARTFVED